MALLQKKKSNAPLFDVKEQLWIVSLVVALGFLTVQGIGLTQAMREQDILEDSFISNVEQGYLQEVEQCSLGGYSETGEPQAAAPEAQDKCVENANNSRSAELLKKYGYEDILQ